MHQPFKKYLEQFIQLEELEWLKILNAIQVKHLKRHEKLLSSNTTCTWIAFVNSGALRTFYNRQGEEITFFFFFENTVASDYESFITRKPTGFCMEAIEDTELLMIPYADIQKLYSQLKEGQKLARFIAEHLYILQRQRTSSLLLLTPEERYLELLRSKSEILNRVNQYYIATYLGIKPQSLSRIRKRLADEARVADL
jgi:CRP-like cAMP-binding protein